jgi:phosphate transport system permease protein
MPETNLTFTLSSPYQYWRRIKDKIVQYSVIAGGLGVISAIVLIFFYLLYVVFPLFLAAEAHPLTSYQVPERQFGKTLLLANEEQNEVGVRFTNQGLAVFFSMATGKTLLIEKIAIPETHKFTSFTQGTPASGIVAYGLDNGQIVIAKYDYKITYPNDVRLITPYISYPLGTPPLTLKITNQAITQLAIKVDKDQTSIAVKTADNHIILSHFKKRESLFDDDLSLEQTSTLLDISGTEINNILLDKDHRNLYLTTTSGRLSFFDISKKNKPVIRQHLNVIKAGLKLTSITFLNGDLSLLVGDSSGTISQWSMVRGEQGRSALKNIRQFKVSDNPITQIKAEQRRKGFIAVDTTGGIGVYHSTAERELIKKQVSKKPAIALSLSPRANNFILETDDKQLHVWSLENEHPEVSLKSLWQQIWYESYSKADYIWQSSSASNDFEPKMSLTPLVFGTLKASFYTMLVAIPLSLMGAIYTAYFMSSSLRGYVKPSIEMMGALPTVILGFLAGLWLAPLIEVYLVSIFGLLIIVPVAVILFAYSWQYLPKKICQQIPEGWDALILIPVILLASWVAFALNTPIEDLFFQGDLQAWLNKEIGISYDQRNSLVVGIAMGIAVIPTIFSITEDAIFSVPKHLTIGSLALGATPWQTMIRVVLLTASPGIFSAIMIGFGRAVGETMIVLMATGNTPVMDLSVFEGMRTLSANIAVEMPESEVDSTHYRVLFLAALVLFLFTFVFNTFAEVIRQRLREKYSSL